jgi:hypothetical protein
VQVDVAPTAASCRYICAAALSSCATPELLLGLTSTLVLEDELIGDLNFLIGERLKFILYQLQGSGDTRYLNLVLTPTLVREDKLIGDLNFLIGERLKFIV